MTKIDKHSDLSVHIKTSIFPQKWETSPSIRARTAEDKNRVLFLVAINNPKLELMVRLDIDYLSNVSDYFIGTTYDMYFAINNEVNSGDLVNFSLPYFRYLIENFESDDDPRKIKNLFNFPVLSEMTDDELSGHIIINFEPSIDVTI